MQVLYQGQSLFGKNMYVSDCLSVGYFQQGLDYFQDDEVVLESIRKLSEMEDQLVYDTLASLGLRMVDCRKRYGQLSGGQKVRANLARVLLGNHQVLCLDEPNNYLDMVAIEALETFLVHYPASLILVSHDERLQKSVCERFYQMKELYLCPQTMVTEQKITSQELTRLKFQRDLLMMKGKSSLAEIREMDEKIRQLEERKD